VFQRVTLHASDLDAATRFYETVLPRIGITSPRIFQLAQAVDDNSVTRRLHIGFAANTREEVDAFWNAGVNAGYDDDGAPGPRPQYREDYYGAFLLDPDGNGIEAVHHAHTPAREEIDHLWIRVADLQAAKQHYADQGLPLVDETPERVQFGDHRGSFSLVPGTTSENVDFQTA
jgi:catechol 2,3-dioxygenase-like lactoylglutathione lyase family enzyme